MRCRTGVVGVILNIFCILKVGTLRNRGKVVLMRNMFGIVKVGTFHNGEW